MARSRSRPRRLRKRPPALRVPGWYYALLGIIALVGGILIVVDVSRPGVHSDGLVTEGDYPMGRPDAPVTIVEWGSFQ